MKLAFVSVALAAAIVPSAQGQMQYVGAVYGQQPLGPQPFMQSYGSFPSSFLGSYGSTNWAMGMQQPFYQPPPMMPPPMMLPPLIPPPGAQGGSAGTCDGTSVCHTVDEQAKKVSALEAANTKMAAENTKMAAQIASLQVVAGVLPPPKTDPAKAMTCFRNDSASGRNFCSPNSEESVWSGSSSPWAGAGAVTGLWRIERIILPDLTVHYEMRYTEPTACDAFCTIAPGRRLLATIACFSCFYMDRQQDGLYWMDHCQNKITVPSKPASTDPRWQLAHKFTENSPVCPANYNGSPSLNLTSFACKDYSSPLEMNWQSCGGFEVYKP